MSLQVRFPFGRGAGPLHSCRACGFGTRHRVLFERHMKRCPSLTGAAESRESFGSMKPPPVSYSMSEAGTSSAGGDILVAGADTKHSQCHVSPGGASAESKQLPSPPVCRNYRCDRCGYSTSRSKSFLCHRKLSHGENITIYPCDHCEYASRHKSKIIRHRNLVHKDAAEIAGFPREMDDDEIVMFAESDGERYSDVYVNEAFVVEDTRPENKLILGGQQPRKASFMVVSDENMNESFEIDEGEEGLPISYKDGEVSFASPYYNQNKDTGNLEYSPTSSASGISDSSIHPDPTEDAYNYIVTLTDDEGALSYTCKLCTYTNNHKWKVASHVRTGHMKKTLFKCPYCDFVTPRKIEWCVHKTTHTNKGVYSCEECSYKTTMKRNFERHVEHHQMNAPYHCTMCSYSSTGEGAVQRHMAEYHPSPEKEQAINSIHMAPPRSSSVSPLSAMKSLAASPTPLSRSLTSTPTKVEGTQSSRQRQSSGGSGSQEATCGLCGMTFVSVSRLRIHMISHSADTPYVCPQCPLRYKRQADLNRHRRSKHGMKLGQDQDQPLDLCVKTSPTGSDSTSTEEQFFPEQPLDLSMKPTQMNVMFGKGQEMKCSHCSYLAKWPSDLRRHMLVHSIEKRFRCHLCNKKYKYQFDLNMHMRKSHRVPVGKTRVSSAAGFTGRGLRAGAVTVDKQVQPLRATPASRSQVSGTSQRAGSNRAPEKYGCTECHFVGSSKADLERHSRIHLLVKPYQCMICQYATCWKGDMKRHLAKHHPLEVEKHGDLEQLLSSTYQGENLDQESVAKAREPRRASFVMSRNHEGRKMYSCSQCSFTTDGQAKLVKHMETHEDLKRYVCYHCGKRSNWISDIRKHIQKEHPDLEVMVQELSEEEARETLPTYLSPSRVQDEALEQDVLDAPPDTDPEVGLDPLADPEFDDGLMDYAKLMDPDCLSKEDLQADWGHMISGTKTTTPEPVPSSSSSLPLVTASLDKMHALSSASMVPRPSVTMPTSSARSLVATVAAGRYRKYKCSKCGRRSNWKWDLRKHIRMTHPSADILEMSEEDAKASFHETLDGKERDMLQSDLVETLTEKPASFRSVELDDRRFQCSACGKRSSRKWDLLKHIRALHPSEPDASVIIHKNKSRSSSTNSAEELVEKRRLSSEQTETQSKRFASSSYHFPISDGTRLRVKRYMCSICPYRSDFRSDIARHLKRRHRRVNGDVVVLTPSEAAATYLKYKQTWGASKKFVLSPEKEQEWRRQVLRQKIGGKNSDPKGKVNPHSQRQQPAGVKHNGHGRTARRSIAFGQTQRLWRCSKCNFRSSNKMVVISHYRIHGTGSAFVCRLCNHKSYYRGSMYRHIKIKHKNVPYYRAISETAIKAIDLNPSSAKIDTSKYDFDDDGEMDVDNAEEEMEEELEEEKPEAVQPSQEQCYLIKYYQCQNCESATVHKHNMIRHIKDKHPFVKNPQQGFDILEKSSPTAPKVGQHRRAIKTTELLQQLEPTNAERRKIDVGPTKLKCDICPFTSTRQGLLKIHMGYHNPPSSDRQLKCRYCSFYVCTRSRLEQHMELHEKEMKSDATRAQGEEPQDSKSCQSPVRTPPPKRFVSPPSSSSKAQGKTHYYCDRCPYISINKNDFIYHKQFHRPKPSAPFKCDLCPYWVSLRRLLTQHAKVHTAAYKEQYYPQDIMQDLGERATQLEPSPHPSPCKSTVSSMSMESLGDISEVKQEIIDGKIVSVPLTPEKLEPPERVAFAGTSMMKSFIVDSNDGELISSSGYRKLHNCRYCPYTNIRASNLRLHEKMHTRSPKKGKELHQCLYCNYSVANKGLLSLHVKVHSLQYKPGKDEINDVELETPDDNTATENQTPSEASKEENEEEEKEEEAKSPQKINTAVFPEKTPVPTEPVDHLDVRQLPDKSDFYIKYNKETGEHVLEKATLRKWCCDKCPYATMKHMQFERHVVLHDSRQRYMCEYCDYSVPSYHMLVQHRKLHLEPNPNLLSAQSVQNLQKLPEVAADVAAAADFTGRDDTCGRFGIHDEMNLYENSSDFAEPKKLYRCDRCPYTNVRRDHLLSHLKFHMVRSALECPYCDYSVSKVHLLNQHIRVHFNLPGAEMNAKSSSCSASRPGDGSGEEAAPEFIDIAELAEKIQKSKQLLSDTDAQKSTADINGNDTSDEKPPQLPKQVVPNDLESTTEGDLAEAEKDGVRSPEGRDNPKSDGGHQHTEDSREPATENLLWVCQYCDRTFDASPDLLKHEMQHLVGSQFRSLADVRSGSPTLEKQGVKSQH